MKKTILSLFVFFAFFAAAFAQKADSKELVWNGETIKQGTVLVRPTIQFDEKNKLTQDAFRSVEELAQFMRLNPEVQIEIRAHVEKEKQGTREISVKRVEEIYAFLIEKGIDKSRIALTAYGSLSPSKEWGNDRIELKFLKTN